ncbi:MAG: ArsR family transcriptional regulator [Candidatus Thermoplasmatota archaeon]|nr:ArsR family transcriptional regulator [Candidatus Thermoplasmatota archaeon]
MSGSESSIEKRRRLYRIIKEYPGLHMREIDRRSEMSLNAVKFHLERLKRHDLVEEKKKEGYNRYYPKKEKLVKDEDQEILSVLRKEKPLKVTVYLLNQGNGAGHKEMSEELDLPPSTLSYHLKQMVKKDILEKREGLYWLSEPEKVSQILMEYEPPEDMVQGFIQMWEDFFL